MVASARPTIRPPAPSKIKILATADDLFYHEGIHTVGVDRIIAGAHVTKATFYKHFRSKDLRTSKAATNACVSFSTRKRKASSRPKRCCVRWWTRWRAKPSVPASAAARSSMQPLSSPNPIIPSASLSRHTVTGMRTELRDSCAISVIPTQGTRQTI